MWMYHLQVLSLAYAWPTSNLCWQFQRLGRLILCKYGSHSLGQEPPAGQMRFNLLKPLGLNWENQVCWKWPCLTLCKHSALDFGSTRTYHLHSVHLCFLFFFHLFSQLAVQVCLSFSYILWIIHGMHIMHSKACVSLCIHDRNAAYRLPSFWWSRNINRHVLGSLWAQEPLMVPRCSCFCCGAADMRPDKLYLFCMWKTTVRQKVPEDVDLSSDSSGYAWVSTSDLMI